MVQHRRYPHRAIAVLAAAAATLSTLVLSAGRADAESVPFTDPSASGYIGLCNAAGKQVTSGTVDEIPFAVRAVASTPSPAGYTVRAGVKATLYAYQPIKGIDAGNWSGQAITGSTFFSNPDHPMAQATVLDYSMKAFLDAYPAQWDGLVQLRMAYGAPGKPQYGGPYPATVLHITGATWQVVQGGSVDCKAGRTKPVEELALPASRFRSASAAIASRSVAATSAASKTAAKAASGSGSAARAGDTGGQAAQSPSSSAAAGRGASASPGRDAVAQAGPSVRAAGASTSSSDGGSAVVVLLVALAAVALAGGAFWALRRREVAG